MQPPTNGQAITTLRVSSGISVASTAFLWSAWTLRVSVSFVARFSCSRAAYSFTLIFNGAVTLLAFHCSSLRFYSRLNSLYAVFVLALEMRGSLVRAYFIPLNSSRRLTSRPHLACKEPTDNLEEEKASTS